MEKQPAKLGRARARLLGIDRVADDGVADGAQMDADLMSTAGLWGDLEESIVLEALEHSILGQCCALVRLAFAGRAHALAGAELEEWRVDNPLIIFYRSINKSSIFFSNQTIMKEVLIVDKRLLVFDQQEQT